MSETDWVHRFVCACLRGPLEQVGEARLADMALEIYPDVSDLDPEFVASWAPPPEAASGIGSSAASKRA